MYLLGNSENTNHAQQFPAPPGKSPAIFDLDDWQIKRKNNEDWHNLMPGDIVALIGKNKNLRPFSTFYVVTEIANHEIADKSVLRGDLVAWANPSDHRRYSEVLREFCAVHRYIDKNFNFMKGSNVLSFGSQLDGLQVQVAGRIAHPVIPPHRIISVGELKAILK